MTTRPTSIPRVPFSRPRTQSHPGSGLDLDEIPTQPLEGPSCATPRETAGNKPSTKRGNENAEEVVRRTCQDFANPLSTRIQDLESSVPRNADAIAAIENRLASLDDQEANPGCNNNDQKDDILASVATLRSNVNDLLETRGTLERAIVRLEQQTTPTEEIANAIMAKLSANMAAKNMDTHGSEEYRLDEGGSENPQEDEDLILLNLPSVRASRKQKKTTSSRSRKSSSKRASARAPRSGVSRPTAYETTSSESESSDGDRDDHDSDGEVAIPITLRQKGPKHPGLSSLQPSDGRYDRLMSYRYYRLSHTSQRRSFTSTTRLHKMIKNLELTLKERKFDGSDPILVFDFLGRLTEECDTLKMSEGQAFIALPHFLKGRAETQYRASANNSRNGGVSCWPEAVQYLLRTYATPAAIRKSTKEFNSVTQDWDEDESTYASRVNEAAYRCGNVHTEDEKMTKFVDGLLGCIRFPVARFRENEPRQQMTLDRLVQYAGDEGDAFRSRNNALTKRVQPKQPSASQTRVLTPVLKPTKRSPPATRNVSFVEPADTASSPAHSRDNQDDLLAMSEGDQTSIATSDLPSTVTDVDVLNAEQLLFIRRQDEENRRRFPHLFQKPQKPRVLPPPIAGNAGSTEPCRLGAASG